MIYLKKAALLVWRIWFYILLILPVALMLPFLVVFTSSEKFYPQFFVCARIWAKTILFGMGFYPKVKAEQLPEKNKSYMLVANHTSIIDIMLMLSVIKQPFVFLGKRELGRIPVFGFFYKRTCILVDRKSARSRQEAFAEAQRRLKQQNSVCIFPEGGVPRNRELLLDEFKDGAFLLAIEHKIPVIPITFHDSKRRFSYKFFSGSPGKLRVKINSFIPTTNYAPEDRRKLKQEVRDVILEELQHPGVH